MGYELVRSGLVGVIIVLKCFTTTQQPATTSAKYMQSGGHVPGALGLCPS